MLAKQKRSAPKGKPITSHQLFPAIIALWFGALFGLGSLAIRPGLIESLVLSSHIDSIIPATAPPLGLTARILLALTLAALGALLGAAIGRRIARPKVEVRQRRRGATPIDDSVKMRMCDAHPDAPARRPISAHDEIGEGGASIAGQDYQQAIAGRRRSLTIAEDEDRAVFHDFAPLPGVSGLWRLRTPLEARRVQAAGAQALGGHNRSRADQSAIQAIVDRAALYVNTKQPFAKYCYVRIF